jgi:hypothetical protein
MTVRWLLCLLVAFAFLATPAEAAKKKKRKRRAAAPTPSGPITVPIEVGVGPMLLVPNAPAIFDQPAFFALQTSAWGVVDQELIRRHRNQIPPWARGYARNIDELKTRPFWVGLVLPEVIVVSPQIKDTGVYGAIWRPLGIGLTLTKIGPAEINVDADLDAVALFVHSQTLGGGTKASQSLTLVLRPGVHLGLTAEIPLGDAVGVQLGWGSDFFVPQPLGRSPLEVSLESDALWHLGGPFAMLTVRFPYTVTP